MYLFLLHNLHQLIGVVKVFTFHNVSISTHDRQAQERMYHALHSTMYLFLPVLVYVGIIPRQTLHSTMYLFLLAQDLYIAQNVAALHSTMYLFLQKRGTAKRKK